MALPGNRGGAAQLLTVRGRRVLAHIPGHKDPVDVTDDSASAHVDHTTHYDPEDGSPHVHVLTAYHHTPKVLPAQILRLLEQAVTLLREAQNVHGIAQAHRQAAQQVPKIGVPLPGAATPPPPAPMMGGAGNPQGGSLPGNRSPMAA